jgi:hypothetical protein
VHATCHRMRTTNANPRDFQGQSYWGARPMQSAALASSDMDMDGFPVRFRLRSLVWETRLLFLPAHSAAKHRDENFLPS